MSNKSIKELFLMVLSAVTVSVLTYGNYIYMSTLNIDGEFADNFYQTISLGRWFHAFLRYYVLPEPFMPVFTPLLSVSLICVSSILFCRLFKLTLIPSVITIIIFISSPQLSYQLEFLNQSDTFAIGLLLCTVSSYALVLRNGYVSFLVSTLLTAMALGIYQTLITYLVAVIVSYYTVVFYRRKLYKGDLAKIVVRCTLSVLMSVALYIIVSSQTKSHFNVNAGSYLSSYLSLIVLTTYLLSLSLWLYTCKFFLDSPLFCRSTRFCVCCKNFSAGSAFSSIQPLLLLGSSLLFSIYAN